MNEQKPRYGAGRAVLSAVLCLLLFVNATLFVGIEAVRGVVSETTVTAVLDGNLLELFRDIGVFGAPAADAKRIDRTVGAAVSAYIGDGGEEAAQWFLDSSGVRLIEKTAIYAVQYCRGESVVIPLDEAALIQTATELELTNIIELETDELRQLFTELNATLRAAEPLAGAVRFLLSDLGQWLFAAVTALMALLLYLVNRRHPTALILFTAIPLGLAALPAAVLALSAASIRIGGRVLMFVAEAASGFTSALLTAAAVLAGLALLTALLATVLKGLRGFRALILALVVLAGFGAAAVGVYRIATLENSCHAAAEAAYAERDYALAADMYLRAGEEGDALDDCRFELAKTALSTDDYLAAEAYLTLAPERPETADMLLRCKYLRGVDLLAHDIVPIARDIFVGLGDYPDAARMVSACDYRGAELLLENGDPANAREIFRALSGYEDSDMRFAEASYALGELAEDADDLRLAIAAFTDAVPYLDGADRLRQANAALAKALFNEGGYTALSEAFSIYTALGDYSNSAFMVERCQEAWAAELEAPVAIEYETGGDGWFSNQLTLNAVTVDGRGRDVTVSFDCTSMLVFSCRILASEDFEDYTVQRDDFIAANLGCSMKVRARDLLNTESPAILLLAARNPNSYSSKPKQQWSHGTFLYITNLADLVAWYNRSELTFLS